MPPDPPESARDHVRVITALAKVLNAEAAKKQVTTPVRKDAQGNCKELKTELFENA
jgi:hypothetical protein